MRLKPILIQCALLAALLCPTAPAAEPIRLWHIMNYEGPREVLAEAVKRFEKANPGIAVKVQTFDNDAYKTKLNIEMQSGTPPDVFFTWGGGLLATLARAERVVDLTDTMAREGWKDRFLPAALGLCTVENRTYAAPVDLACVPLWVNRALLEKHGLAAPKTCAELIALCKALDAKGVTPIALGNRKSWPGAFHFIYLATRIGGTQLFLDAVERKPGARFDDPAFVRAGEKLQQLVALKAFSRGCNGIDTGEARTQFFNGDAAMYLMGTWLVARVIKEKPGFIDKLTCVPFPAVQGGKGDATTVVGGVNCAFAVSSHCRQKDAAIALVRFLSDEQVGRDWARIGRIPAIKIPDEALAKLPQPTKDALALLRKAAALQPYYDQYMPIRLAAEHKKTTQELFAGTLTPQQAATRVEAAAQKLR